MKKLKLHKLGDERYDRFSALFIGEPEVGKTSLARQAGFMLRKKADGTPDWSRMLFVPCEEGHKSIADLKDISVWVPFRDGKPADLLAALDGDQDDFDVVFIDGIDTLMREVFHQFEEAEKMKANPNMQRVWGQYGENMLLWLSRMVKLPGVTVLFTGHPKTDEEGDIRYTIATQGGSKVTPDTVLGLFDYVFYMTWKRLDPKSKPVRCFRTTRDPSRGGDSRYACKSRIDPTKPQLPAVMEADLKRLWDTLFDHKDEPAKPEAKTEAVKKS